MHATTATCLLGGSGSGPEKFFAYSSLFFRYSSVAVISTSLSARKRPDDNNTAEACHESKSPRSDGRRALPLFLEVVDRGLANLHGREVLLHPLRDLTRGTAAIARRPESLARDEIPHIVVLQVVLELRQRGRVVAAGEPADRHDRRAGLELETAHRERADTRCGPTVVKSLHELSERRVVGLGTGSTGAPRTAGAHEVDVPGRTRRRHRPGVCGR